MRSIYHGQRKKVNYQGQEPCFYYAHPPHLQDKTYFKYDTQTLLTRASIQFRGNPPLSSPLYRIMEAKYKASDPSLKIRPFLFLFKNVVTSNGSGTLGDIIQIVTKNNHTCALTGGGGLWCWGQGADGRLVLQQLNFFPFESPFPLRKAVYCEGKN